MEGIEHRIVNMNGINMHVAEKGTKGNPVTAPVIYEDGPRNTPWLIETTPIATEDQIPPIQSVQIPAFIGLKSYSLRNGLPEDVVPYLLTTAIPQAYYWVPMNGLQPSQALSCIDGFIRCYLYRFAAHPVAGLDADAARKAAIILGVSRAVMMDNYKLTQSDINQDEICGPLMSVEFTQSSTPNVPPAPTYTALVANSDAGKKYLTDDPKLTGEELNFAKVMLRSAQTVIPLQGLNIITDGHHYLSDKQKSSFRAFFAVEKQLWVAGETKRHIDAHLETVRDALWHKSGHPVSVQLKEAIACDPTTKTLLNAAKLGSAAARLPAMETDLRAADTYLKVVDSINAIWEPLGGNIDAEILRYRTEIIKEMPRTRERLARPVDMDGGITVETREEALLVLKDTLAKNADKVAVAFGFYEALMQAAADETGDQDPDVLRAAHSLNRLKKNHKLPHLTGVNHYKNYKAMMAKARAEGDYKQPTMKFTN